MVDSRKELAVCGTIVQAPTRGAVEITADALIEVDDRGLIRRITAPEDIHYGRRRDEALAQGVLTVLRRGQYLLPGLIDLHVHAPQWPQLGKALHLPLSRWLHEQTFPLEARYREPEFARRVYRDMVSSLLANGTTTALYFGTIHTEANQILAQTCLELGQRALVGKVAMDDSEQCPDYYRDPSPAHSIGETREFVYWVQELRGNGDGLVRPVVTPRFIPSCSNEALEGLGRVAHETCAHIQTHCSESDWEHAYVRDRMGSSDTEALASFGLLTRATVLAHCNFVDGADARLIAARGSGIAHCPLSNIYFANAVFPLRAMLERGLHVGLGTDISGGPSASMFDSCRQAIAASRALEDGVDSEIPAARRGRSHSRVDFRDALWLATTGGGEVLNLPIGLLRQGYQFDAIVIDTSVPGSTIHIWDQLDDMEDIAQKIVFGASPANVTTVWVAGRQVVVAKSPT